MNRIRFYLSGLLIILGLVMSSPVLSWTINSNFECGTAGRAARGNCAFSEPFSSTQFTQDEVYSGKLAAKTTVSKGTDGWGQWGGYYHFPRKLYRGDQVWFRAYFYFPAGFNFYTAGQGLKILRIHVLTSTGHNVGYPTLYINGSSWNGYYLEVVNEVGTTSGDPVCAWKHLGTLVKTGKWMALEMYVKFEPDRSGIIRAWQNGNLVFDESGISTLKESTDKSMESLIFTYFNNNSRQTQSAYIDDVVITSDQPSERDAHGNYFIGLSPARISSEKANRSEH